MKDDIIPAIRAAHTLFEDPALKAIKEDLGYEANADALLTQALKQWLIKQSGSTDTDETTRSAAPGRYGLTILGLSSAERVSDYVAASALYWITTELQPELCRLILDVSVLSPASSPADPQAPS